jgi:hypothetical protein
LFSILKTREDYIFWLYHNFETTKKVYHTYSTYKLSKIDKFFNKQEIAVYTKYGTLYELEGYNLIITHNKYSDSVLTRRTTVFSPFYMALINFISDGGIDEQ